MSDDTLFYRALEDRFRGSRELITARLQVYRPYLMGLLDLFDTLRPWISVAAGANGWPCSRISDSSPRGSIWTKEC